MVAKADLPNDLWADQFVPINGMDFQHQSLFFQRGDKNPFRVLYCGCLTLNVVRAKNYASHSERKEQLNISNMGLDLWKYGKNSRVISCAYKLLTVIME